MRALAEYLIENELGIEWELSRQLNAEADGEISIARDNGCYDHLVTNDELDSTVAEITRIIDQQ